MTIRLGKRMDNTAWNPRVGVSNYAVTMLCNLRIWMRDEIQKCALCKGEHPRLDQEQHPTLIINIYNTKKTSQITDLRTYLRKHMRNNTYNGIIITGDFNLHHPLWNPSNRHDCDPLAEVLIDIMSQLQLKPMLRPAGTITFIPAKTTIDLVWGNEYIERRIIKCRIAKSCEHGSDHHPIET